LVQEPDGLAIGLDAEDLSCDLPARRELRFESSVDDSLELELYIANGLLLRCSSLVFWSDKSSPAPDESLLASPRDFVESFVLAERGIASVEKYVLSPTFDA